MTTTITKGATTVTPITLTGYEATQASGNILHPVLGRADMDVSFNPLGLRTGTLTFLFDTLTHALQARDLHASSGICVLADSDHASIGMRYVASGDVTLSLDDDSRSLWTVAIDFTEVY